MGKKNENVESLELFGTFRLELKIYSFFLEMGDDHNDFAVYRSLGLFFRILQGSNVKDYTF